MSTQSSVGIPHGDGWRGRYINWNGYPTWQARVLLEIVQRDGVEKAAKTLVTGRNYGWSLIYSDTNKEGIKNGKKLLGKRSRIVPGYGLAYTTVEDQSRPDDWVTPETAEEWNYVLGPKSLHIFAGTDLIASLPYDQPIDEGLLQAIEDKGYGA